ncbi:TRAM domain-containing protein [Candidatus Micrarchaeota archaeon]|nr:TRAM domain-containing protein [Candidatus Micrarchaeota archaeon]
MRSFGSSRFRGSEGGGFEKPVKNGEEYDVTIEAVGARGDGIAKVKNFVIFVPGVQANEQVHIRINEVHDKFATAEVIRV